MTPRWAGKSPDARRRDEATLTKRVVESRQRRRWAFSGPPLRGDTLFGRPRRRSSSTTNLSRLLRRRSLMPAENRVVAGSLAIFRSSQPQTPRSLSRRSRNIRHRCFQFIQRWWFFPLHQRVHLLPPRDQRSAINLHSQYRRPPGIQHPVTIHV